MQNMEYIGECKLFVCSILPCHNLISTVLLQSRIKGGFMRFGLFLIIIIRIVSAYSSGAPEVQCPIADDNRVVLEFTLNGEYSELISTEYGEFVRFHIPTGGFIGQVGTPEIPVWSTLIAVPDDKYPSVDVETIEWERLEGVRLYPVQTPESSQDFEYDESAYSGGIYGKQAVTLGSPGIMRDFRVVPVNFYPFRYDAKADVLRIARKIRVRISFDNRDTRNAKSQPDYISEPFAALYRSVIANYWYFERDRQLQRGTILYIVRDDFFDELEPLFNWKRRQGLRVRTALSYEDIGGGDAPSSAEIMSYIQNAYDNWEFPPDYVVLCGDCVMGGMYLPDYDYYSPFTEETYPSDHQYSLVDGDDYFSDIMVGRLAIDLETEAETYSAKVIQYESDPFVSGSDWLTRATLVAANCCGSPQPTTPRLVNLWVWELALNNGYEEADTFFCYGSTCPRGASEISAYIDDGVSFINYRGWGGSAGWTFPSFYVGDVLGLNNSGMLPFVTSIVCGTGDYDSPTTDPCFGEAWIRAGTPVNPKGAVDFYGPSDHDTHTKWNNPNCEGFYWAFLKENLSTFGQCVLRAKMTMFLAYPDNRAPGDGVEHYGYVYNILGDPSVNLWRTIPDSIQTILPEQLNPGDSRIPVYAYSGSAPLENALVSVWFFHDDDPYTMFTDESGTATISIPPEQTIEHDSISVVISKPHYVPYMVTIPIAGEMNAITIQDCIVDDDMLDESDGNDDGIISPGETIELWLTVKNESEDAIDNLQATILEREEFDILQNDVIMPNIETGESSIFEEPIIIRMVSNIPDSFELALEFVFSRSGEQLDTASYTFIIGSPEMELDTIYAVDDGILSPGETADMVIYLKNVGSVASRTANVVASGGYRITLESVSTNIPAISPAGSESIDPEITITADSGLINGIIDQIEISFDDGYYYQELSIPILIGEISTSTFGGPDIYGYFCYDNTDIESGRAPTFDWIEISPYYGGEGTAIGLEDDETVVIPLPFDFVYYGRTYNSISVSDNGWLAMGEIPVWIYNNFYNRPLPDPSGPPAMICPFWDDLYPHLEDYMDVFYRYISEENIFVVEWHTVNGHDDTTVEWFQVILRDPEYYPAHYGFGEIIFQYRDIADIDSLEENHNALAEYSTIGIQDHSRSVAIQYKFAGELASHAADIDSGTAILFTTKPPVAIDTSSIDDWKSQLPDNIQIVLTPNPFNSTQTIQVKLPYPAQLNVDVLDYFGRIVANIADGNYFAGVHNFVWGNTDMDGAEIPSGIYLIRLTTADQEIIKKAIFIR